MDDELALRKAMDRAAKVEALLRNEMLLEAFVALKAAYITAWEMTDPRDADGRETAWLAVTVLGRLQRDLATVISDGKVATHQLAVMEKRRTSA